MMTRLERGAKGLRVLHVSSIVRHPRRKLTLLRRSNLISIGFNHLEIKSTGNDTSTQDQVHRHPVRPPQDQGLDLERDPLQ